MRKPWNIYNAALVGCGRIGYSLGLDKKREQPASHTMALKNNPRINLMAGIDTNEVNLEQWRKANRKAAVYTDSANFYARYKSDIIVVAVNEESHVREAVAAIAVQPKLVILEKPVALNMQEAVKIKEMAEIYSVPVMVNHERRFAKDYIMAKEALGSIGELQSIHASLHSGLCVYNPEEENTGSYSLIHDGTHLIDTVLYFLEDGEPSALETVKIPVFRMPQKGSGLLKRSATLNSQPVEYREKFQNSLLNNPVITGLKYDDKNCIRQLTANFTTSRCPDVSIEISGRSKFFGFDIDIYGTEGRICIGNNYIKIYRRQESPFYSGFYSLMEDKTVVRPKMTEYFSNMLKNAVDFLDGKEQLRSSLENGMNALAVIDEIKSKIR